jgi:hypothetical protein
MLWGHWQARRGRSRLRRARWQGGGGETPIAGELRLVELAVPGEVTRQAREVLKLSREVGTRDAPGFETETQVLQVALLHGLVSMGERYRDAFEAARAEGTASG